MTLPQKKYTQRQLFFSVVFIIAQHYRKKTLHDFTAIKKIAQIYRHKKDDKHGSLFYSSYMFHGNSTIALYERLMPEAACIIKSSSHSIFFDSFDLDTDSTTSNGQVLDQAFFSVPPPPPRVLQMGPPPPPPGAGVGPTMGWWC